MSVANYEQRRQEIEHYFDRTAAATWAKLTSDAPVGRIRQTVREGRDAMRDTLLSWLPADLSGRRILDAGCGTGAFALEASRRGADVVAVDLSPTLIELARDRIAEEDGAGRIDFRVGDMRKLDLGTFDHIVAMDSLIHYESGDGLRTLAAMAATVRESIVFTFAPKTPLLGAMHRVGKWFPRGNRSPAIAPMAFTRLRQAVASQGEFVGWTLARDHRIARGFYISHAVELTRS